MWNSGIREDCRGVEIELTDLKLLISLRAQSTMKALGFHNGISDVNRWCNNRIHGVRSSLAVFKMRTNATRMPLCQSLKTIIVYKGNYTGKRDEHK